MSTRSRLTALAALAAAGCLTATAVAPAALAAPGDPATKAAPAVERVAGANRLETAIDASRVAFDDGTADAVVLARSDDFPDSLAAGPLASDRGGPLLLTPPASLAPAVAAEIRRVLAPGGTAYLLGGTGALSAEVERAVQALGARTQRVQGRDRYATAVEVAKLLPDAPHTALVTGLNYPDGLAAGALMGVQLEGGTTNGVVLLTAGSTLPAATRDYLTARGAGGDGTYVVPVGGDAVRAAQGLPAGSLVPIAGTDRYDTAARVAGQFLSGGAFFDNAGTAVGVATGEDWPDALAGSAVMGYTAGPLLLTKRASLPPRTAEALRLLRDDAAGAGGVSTALVFGGPGAVSADQDAQIGAALG